MAPKYFIVDRKIDYTVTQSYAVVADDAEQAVAKMEKFVEVGPVPATGAASEAPTDVVQFDDYMDQIENTYEVEVRQASRGDEASLGKSLLELIVQARAEKMLALLRRISNAGLLGRDMGEEVDAMLEGIDKSIAEGKAQLKAVTGSLV